MDHETASIRYQINNEVYKIADKYAAASKPRLCRWVFTSVMNVYYLYDDKSMLYANMLFTIRRKEFILDRSDADKFITDIFELLESVKDRKPIVVEYKTIKSGSALTFEFDGKKITLPECRINPYLQYVSEQELFNTLLYHSYIAKYPESPFTLGLDFVDRLIKKFNKSNMIEIVDKYLDSALLLLPKFKFHLKTMNPATDSKFNYLGHIFSDTYLDDSLVLVRLFTPFMWEFFFISELMTSALRTYKNITFVVVKPQREKRLFESLLAPEYFKYSGIELVPYANFNCESYEKGSVETSIYVFSNDKIPDVGSLFT